MQRPIIYCLYVLLALGSAQLRHVTSLSHSGVISGGERSEGGSGRSGVLPHRYSDLEDAPDSDVSENKGFAVSSKQQQRYHTRAADNDDTGYLHHRDSVSQFNDWQLEKLLASGIEPGKRTNSDRSLTQLALSRNWVSAPSGASSRYHAAGGAGGGGNSASRRDTRRQFKFGKKSTSANIQRQQQQQMADFEEDSDNAVVLSDQIEREKSKPTTTHKRKMIKFGKKSINPTNGDDVN